HLPIRWRHEKDLIHDVTFLAFSADGQTLGMLGWIGAPDDNGLEQITRGAYEPDEPSHLARVWDVASGRVRSERPLRLPLERHRPKPPGRGFACPGPQGRSGHSTPRPDRRCRGWNGYSTP